MPCVPGLGPSVAPDGQEEFGWVWLLRVQRPTPNGWFSGRTGHRNKEIVPCRGVCGPLIPGTPPNELMREEVHPGDVEFEKYRGGYRYKYPDGSKRDVGHAHWDMSFQEVISAGIRLAAAFR